VGEQKEIEFLWVPAVTKAVTELTEYFQSVTEMHSISDAAFATATSRALSASRNIETASRHYRDLLSEIQKKSRAGLLSREELQAVQSNLSAHAQTLRPLLNLPTGPPRLKPMR